MKLVLILQKTLLQNQLLLVEGFYVPKQILPNPCQEWIIFKFWFFEEGIGQGLWRLSGRNQRSASTRAFSLVRPIWKKWGVVNLLCPWTTGVWVNYRATKRSYFLSRREKLGNPYPIIPGKGHFQWLPIIPFLTFFSFSPLITLTFQPLFTSFDQSKKCQKKI